MSERIHILISERAVTPRERIVKDIGNVIESCNSCKIGIKILGCCLIEPNIVRAKPRRSGIDNRNLCHGIARVENVEDRIVLSSGIICRIGAGKGIGKNVRFFCYVRRDD